MNNNIVTKIITYIWQENLTFQLTLPTSQHKSSVRHHLQTSFYMTFLQMLQK